MFSPLNGPALKRIAVQITLGLLAAWPSIGISQTLDYGPYSGFGLGKGILGNDYTQPLASCIIGTQSTLAADGASVFVSIAYSSNEYSSAFHIDQSAQATFLNIGGGGEELHFGQNDSRAERAFDIIVEAYGQHPSQTLDNIDWDSVHKASMTSGDPAQKEAVRLECGDRYIQTVFNESRLFAVLHVSSVQTSSLTQFSGKANGSVGIGIVSAAASLGGDANIKSANQSGAISINLYSEGLGGIIPTAAAVGIASGDGLQDIANKLSAYLTGLHDNGQPVKYRLASLPGMNLGDLTDRNIFDDLSTLKDNYNNTYARLSNVRSLLLNTDPRRLILIQPDADNHLREQQNKVRKYETDAAKAHDTCRKAHAVDVCDHSLNTLGDPPAPIDAEIPPILAPTLIPFGIAINGRMMPQADVTLIFGKAGTTVLEAARKNVQSDAQNVDVIAVLIAPYLSHLDMPILAPNPPFVPTTVGVLVLRAQDLKFPTYWKATPKNVLAIHVAHADANSPCPIIVVAGLNTMDQSCLTTVGKAIRDIGLTEAAEATKPSIPTLQLPLGGITTDCFGISTGVFFSTGSQPSIGFPIEMGGASGELAWNPTTPAQRTTNVRESLWTGYTFPYIVLFQSSETHDFPAWAQLASSRLAAIPTTGLGLSGVDLCSPHVQ